MDFSTLTRDASKIHGALKEMKDGSVVALEPVKIYIPVRFSESGLAHVDDEVSTVAIFGITVQDKYLGVSCTVSNIRLDPSSIGVVECEDGDYHEFSFETGATVFVYTDLVQVDTLPYSISSEFIDKGKVPSYLTYDDTVKLFDTSGDFTGMTVGANHALAEMVCSVIFRQQDDLGKYYRKIAEEPGSKRVPAPAVVPNRSVAWGATNTTAKLTGAYFSEGLTSALINPSERSEQIEELLRR
ncbi:MAG: hypothetical protein CL678_15860 [Bdellovibrionaceae bacterium]|nr:hypothetical protein [Pseudobdellovibrionaceae bacterium]